MPAIECPCGVSINVEEFEAGSSRDCPECGESNRIPSLAKLRMLDGETNPYLDSTARLVTAIQESRAPFDGQCLKCSKEATVEFPIRARFLKERFSSDSPVRASLFGATLDFSAEEHWVHLPIPFRFCESCGSQFRKRAILGRVFLVIGTLLVIAIGIPLFLVAHVFGIFLMLPLIWGLSQISGRTRVDRRLDPYVSKHSILEKVFAGEDEVVIRVGRRRRL